jgi:putative adhesin
MRTESFQTPNPVRLDIRLGAGEVRLEASQTTETTVRLEPLRDNDASVAAVEEARVEQRGDEILIDVRERRRGFRGSEVLVEVRCPEGSSVRGKTGSADVEGHGRFGSADVETGSGDVQFGELSEEAKVNAASGDVQIGSVGGEGRINTASGDVQVGSFAAAAKINSASGDVQIGEVGGRLEVNSASGDVAVREASSAVSMNTASGDQTVGSVVEGKVELKSASGELKIGIREGSTLWVDARSRSGEVTSELPVSDLPPEGDAPHVELRANTMSGDITIVRA